MFQRSGAAALVLAMSAVVALGGSVALAGADDPASEPALSSVTAQLVWQHACEDAAKGTISPQPSLVCTHEGFPQWSDGQLRLLEQVCEQALGGTFVRRSEFPVELAACFFD